MILNRNRDMDLRAEKQKKDIVKILLVAIISICSMIIINVVAYEHLPDVVSTKSSGNTLMSKETFLIQTPIILVLGNAYNIKINKGGFFSTLFFNILFLGVITFVIFHNL